MTITSARMRASGTVAAFDDASVRLGCLLGDSAVAAAAMRSNNGKTDSTPVKMCGEALGKSKLLTRLRMADMTHSGITAASTFLAVRGVLLPLAGVFGVLRADAPAAVALLLGV
jgi:vancomycin permeability regulator SanA